MKLPLPHCSLLLLALLLLEGCYSKQSDQRPNIVLIMADDMGYSDLGSYGSEIQTPNLDRLAEEGMRMTQFYNTAKCTETRATLLTGLYFQQTDNLLQPDNNVTLAEVLKENGYQTLMSGKWHLGNWEEEIGTPNQRGFDHYFGFLGGAINFFTGLDYGTGRNYMRLDQEEYKVPDDFYSTDNFTSHALTQVSEAAQQDQPFFLYLAYNAPHYPLQAPEENIQKYRGRYQIGWDSLRQQRLQKMHDLGIIKEQWQLSPRDTLAPAWESLSEHEQQEEQALMEVYAGMVDRLDQQIGRLLHHLDSLGIADNTLIMFLSDNGGCPFDANRTPDIAPGPAQSRRTYDTEWAQASNTPFRKYKQWIHEGGIATPMIIRWPGQIAPNSITDQPGQILDMMPTLVEIASATYPKKYDGYEVLPMEGVSLLPIWQGNTLERERPLFWEYRGSRALRDGNWKLVGERGGAWELYNLANDRSEMNNLIDQEPDRAAQMIKTYDAQAKRVGARTTEEAIAMPLNQQDRYLYEDEKGSASGEE
ncbi:MAG: arylsulfatase [Cyclobacteriaceae bacterium]